MADPTSPSAATAGGSGAASGSSFKKRRHAGLPGSLSAIRVDYNRHITAFDAPANETEVGSRRVDVRRWRQGHRLGDKPEWQSSTVDDKTSLFPKRPLMHTLSEFQAVKIDYNYRTSTLPQVNKKTVFVPKPNKMQIDRTQFLSAKEKSMLVDQCPATVSKLSVLSMKNEDLPGVEREGGWNNSTAPDESRSNIFKPKEYEDLRAFNKAKGIVDPNTYVSPIQRQKDIASTVRHTKLVQREMEAEATRRRLQSTRPNLNDKKELAFTMSNIGEWWDKNPVAELQNAHPASANARPAGGGSAGSRGTASPPRLASGGASRGLSSGGGMVGDPLV